MARVVPPPLGGDFTDICSITIPVTHTICETDDDIGGISLDMNPNFSSAQAAAFLGVKVATLSDWRYRGRGPRYVKMGRRVHYRYSDILEFRQRCLV